MSYSLAKKLMVESKTNGNGHHPVKKMDQVLTLDTNLILNEIANPALKHLAKSVLDVANGLKTGNVDADQARGEINVAKLLLQIIVIDRAKI